MTHRPCTKIAASIWLAVLFLGALFGLAHKAWGHPVKRWAPVVEQECQRVGLAPCPVQQTLALIDVESDGRAARRKSPTSQYYGLLQIGTAAAREAGIQASDTHGDGRLAIRAHLTLRKRYAYRWDSLPTVGVALFWKMGAGALRRVVARVEDGEDLESAVRAVSAALHLGRSREYLRRYLEALRKLQGVTPC